ncbi:hypothetical protein BGZ83_000719 [Gryganskiella cystojenkinii]|nr:hypothetical protein BGZ83_000719 [Gryganskiella cystojenkinii]
MGSQTLKSIHHYLILPRQEVENLMVLRSDRGGLELIKEMERQGNLLIQSQLHMHVMSTDFTSHVPYKAKCYKDFTTRLFLRVEELKRHLDKEGKFRLSKQTMNEIHQDNNAPMICLQCQSSLPTVQIRNAHMQQHLQQRKIEWESSVAVV